MCWRQLQRVGTLYFETESFSLFLFCFGELGIQTLMGNGPFFFLVLKYCTVLVYFQL